MLGQYEKVLRLGPGVFGPHSRFNIFKMLNGFGATYWFYQQFRRIGAGQPIDMKFGVFSVLIMETPRRRRPTKVASMRPIWW